MSGGNNWNRLPRMPEGARRNSTVLVALLLLLFPAGLWLVWRHRDWDVPFKLAVSGATVLVAMLVFASVLTLFGVHFASELMELPAENLWLGIISVIGVTAAVIGLALVMRTHAPPGGFFSDSDRAAAVFGATGTMLSVLLALVILLSVETYRTTKAHAHAESDSVLQQFQLARLFSSQDQYAIQSELICYGRSVSSLEWPLMKDRNQSTVVDGWGVALEDNIDSMQIRGAKAESGFEFFLAQNLQRQEERRGRLEGASGTLPEIVWPILLIGAAATVAYLLAYADSTERRGSQVFQVGLVTFVLGSSLLLIGALDRPFGENPGQIQPDQMDDAVLLMEQQLGASIDSPRLDTTLPCDNEGTLQVPEPNLRLFDQGTNMARIARDGTFRIGVSYSLSLFGQLDPVSGRLSGFDVDLAREIARELGMREDQIEFVDTPVEDRIPYLENGTVDMVVLAMTITPERAELVEFSQPYFLAGQSLMVSRTNRTINGLRDVADKRVCAVPGSTSATTLPEMAPDVEMELLPSFNACVSALESGEVDAVGTDDIVLAGYAKENDDLVLVGGQFTSEPYGVAVPKGQTDLTDFVDGIISEMLRDGRWGKLYYEYLGDIAGLPEVSDAKDRLNALEVDAGD